ncbi:dienelactone hydrolase family protein [Streptomyces sp. NPDC057638]|uniref:dienelactone hydrolase family protein n=1 Tax=Streptomyces sp. NPDC057638 TaxID=3346190 RepID=UPI003691EFFB
MGNGNPLVRFSVSSPVKTPQLLTLTATATALGLTVAAAPAVVAAPATPQTAQTAQTAQTPQTFTTAPAPKTSSAPRSTALRTDRATLTSYRLAPGLLKITPDPKGGNPTQVHGLLGMPRGKGPHPVAVVLHGAHHNCVTTGKDPYISPRAVTTTWPLVCARPGKPERGLGPDYLRQNMGLSHTVETLARKGFAAVAIDVVSPEIWWGGETDAEKGYTQLVDAHLRLLRDLNKGVNHGLAVSGLTGRIDTSRVGLVGHSRGGGYVLSPKAAQRAGLFGAVAIQPLENADKATHKVPVLNIRGACDEDVLPDAGLGTMKKLAASRSTTVAADVLLAGTGHRMVNSNLAATDPGGTIGGCKAAKVASPAAARAQVAQLTADFLHQALRKAPSYRLPALTGLAPKGGNLRKGGPAVTFRDTPRATLTDPRTVREITSKERILPAIPKGLKIAKRPDAGI